MNTPAFTTNPYRIARLQRNYNEGAQREKASSEQREQMDRCLMAVSPEHISKLFSNVEVIRKSKKQAAAAARAAAAI